MTSALYGRMALGRCVEEDSGHLGCSNSALEAMDELCSGKRSCKFDVVKETKRLWENTQHACPRALMGSMLNIPAGKVSWFEHVTATITRLTDTVN